MKKKDAKHSSLFLKIYGWIFVSSALFLFLALLSFRTKSTMQNYFGLFGWSIGYASIWLFGFSAYLFPPALGWLGLRLLRNIPIRNLATKGICFGLLVLSLCFLLNLYAEKKWFLTEGLLSHIYTQTAAFEFPLPRTITRCYLGGVPWYFLYKDLPFLNLRHLLSDLGIGLAFGMTAIASFFLMTELKLRTLLSFARATWAQMAWKENISPQKPIIAKEKPLPPVVEEVMLPPTRVHLGHTSPPPPKPPKLVSQEGPISYQLPPWLRCQN